MQCVAAVRPAAAVQRPAVRSASSSSAFVGSSLRAAPLRAQTLRPARRQVCVAGLFGLGVPELAVIAGVAALIFGERSLRRPAALLSQPRRRSPPPPLPPPAWCRPSRPLIPAPSAI